MSVFHYMKYLVLVFVITVSASVGLVIPADAVTANLQSSVQSHLKGVVGLSMDRKGYLYTASVRDGAVYSFSPASAPVMIGQVQGRPVALAVDRMRNVFVVTEDGVVSMITTKGQTKEIVRVDFHPAGITIDRDGGILVVGKECGLFKIEGNRILPLLNDDGSCD
ncbi:hypothetical protein [Maridesulfovibrio sp. FT414]|uniref:hypothetical protein n=1 Tax=Maridesulfovibrio sp. FT414 TaxID=2979469 RepID=UPI003D805BC9